MSKKSKNPKPKKVDVLELSKSEKPISSRKLKKNCDKNWWKRDFGSHLLKSGE
jgi:hypothetical protein